MIFLFIGDTLDVLLPDDIDTKEFVIEKLYDVETDEEIPTINPGKKGQQVKILIPYKNIEKNTIIRRKK